MIINEPLGQGRGNCLPVIVQLQIADHIVTFPPDRTMRESPSARPTDPVLDFFIIAREHIVTANLVRNQ
jgi:hypothetical protein